MTGPWVKTGRIDSRRRCAGCNARIKLGDPAPTDTWPHRLHLTDEELDLLLVAAADYRDLAAEVGEPESAVSFADWLAGVSRQSGVHVEHDGAPARNESGTLSDRASKHRHPDPLPVWTMPRTWQR